MVRSYRCSTTCELFCLADMFWNQRPVTSTYTADFWHHQWRSNWLHALSSGRDWEAFVAIWLTPSAHAYSIGKHIQLLDKRLLSIKPPDTISRVPQAISNRKKWKGVVVALLCMHVYFTSLCMFTKHIQHRNLGLGCYITASQCWRGSFHTPTMTTLLCWCAACTSCLETTSLVKGSHKLKACLMSFTKSLKNYMVS